MPVWDRQPKIQSSSVEETLQRIMGQTNNDCRFLISTLTSFPTPATFACWKVRFKTEVCTCSTISYGSNAKDGQGDGGPQGRSTTGGGGLARVPNLRVCNTFVQGVAHAGEKDELTSCCGTV